MSQKQSLTILFADVSGSTKLFETRGDVEARRLTSAILAALSDVTSQCDGRVVKTIGDEIMCTFPDAGAAVRAAVDMQRRVALDAVFAEDRLAIRIGLHHGDTLLEEDGDVYGDAVNTAARVAALAKREQIITTASTVEKLPERDAFLMRSVGQARVAGKLQPLAITEVMWQEDTGNLTVMQSVDHIAEDAQRKLRLRYREQVIELEALAPPFTLGRNPNSSLVVDAGCVSRNHGAIEFKRGYFTISDCSTNGTWVTVEGDEELRLHRDEVHLHKRGVISLGQAVALNPDHRLLFECGG